MPIALDVLLSCARAWRRKFFKSTSALRNIATYVGSVNLERITVDPAVMSGKPCLRGLRVTVANVLRQLASHRTPEQILAAYPYLEAADIDACLHYAAVLADYEELALAPS